MLTVTSWVMGWPIPFEAEQTKFILSCSECLRSSILSSIDKHCSNEPFDARITVPSPWAHVILGGGYTSQVEHCNLRSDPWKRCFGSPVIFSSLGGPKTKTIFVDGVINKRSCRYLALLDSNGLRDKFWTHCLIQHLQRVAWSFPNDKNCSHSSRNRLRSWYVPFQSIAMPTLIKI